MTGLRPLGLTMLCLVLVNVGCQHPRHSDPSDPAEDSTPTTDSQDSLAETPPVVTDDPLPLIDIDELTLERQTWAYGDTAGVAWRVRVPLPGAVQLATAEDVVEFNTLLPTDDGPWAAINGGFYDVGPLGLVVSDGIKRSPLTKTGGSGVFLMDDRGPRIIHRDYWKPGPVLALQSVDRIVDGRKSLVQRREDPPLAARSAVAVGDQYLWLVLAVANESISRADTMVVLTRTSGHGLPLHAFADYLIATTDAHSVLNLDGAISSQMEVCAGPLRFRVVGEAGTVNAVVMQPE